MPTIEYRMFFDNEPATQDQLDTVEAVTVEQDVDMAWEARLEIPLCTDASGKWSGEDEPILADFGRVRLEVKVGPGKFVPLIDGPVVGFDSSMSSEPGQSRLVVLVHDDSVLLNREEKVETFEGKADHEIARKVLKSIPEIATVDVDDTRPQPIKVRPVEIQRGTGIELLRALARRQDMHAYVLPGPAPGKSIGAFKKLPTRGDGLPDMVLTGPDRNIRRFDVKNEATRPGRTEGYAISLTDKKVVKRTSSFRKVDRLGKEPGLAKEADAGTYLLPPDLVDSVDLEAAVQAGTNASSYQFEASGALLTECYGEVLTPYRVVTATGVNGRLSGDYVVTGVTHRLTRAAYEQTFRLLRNARSSGAGGGGGLPDIF
jgi:hypothetical protein